MLPLALLAALWVVLLPSAIHAQACSGTTAACVVTTEDLDCSGQSLTTVPCNLPLTLVNVGLNENAITAIPSGTFDNMDSVNVLNLNANSLQSLPSDTFQGVPAVNDINVQQNQLTSLVSGLFANLPALVSVHADSNQLTSIASDVFQNLASLDTLTLNANFLTSLPSFSGMSSLRVLHLHDNLLTSLDATNFQGLTRLSQLFLQRNALVTMGAGVFNGLTALRTLNLNDNRISTFAPFPFSGLGLTNLYMNSNRLSALPSFNGLSLVLLSASNNLITQLDATTFTSQSQLLFLDLSTNYIRGLPVGLFDDATTLQKLFLHSNLITTIAGTVFDNCGNLDILTLGNNLLSSINNGTFVATVNLKRLDLQNNRITRLVADVFATNVNLEKLNLVSNQLNSLPSTLFQGLTKLRELSVYHNSLTSLNVNLLVDQTDLDSLSVRSNAITSLPIGIFSTNNKLANLAANMNQLTKLPLGTFSNAPIKILHLEDNPVITVHSDTFQAANPDEIYCALGDVLCTDCEATCGVHSVCDWNSTISAIDCSCQIGYSGSPCGDTDFCLVTPCGGNTSCVDQAAPSINRTCTCLPGYEGNPYIGCTEIDACVNTPCGQNTDCVDLAPPSISRVCSCLTGFEGNPDVNCTDIDTCLILPDFACGVNASCFDLPAPSLNRTCECNPQHGGDAYTACAFVPPDSSTSFFASNAPWIGVLIGVGVIIALVALILLARRKKSTPNAAAPPPKGHLKSWEYDPDHMTIIRELGPGTYGRVVEASATGLPHRTSEPVRVVVSFLTDNGPASSPAAAAQTKKQDAAFKELAGLLVDLKHPNILDVQGVHFANKAYFIVSEFMENGDLKTYLQQCKAKPGSVGLPHLLRLTRDVCNGFAHMQAMSFVHRDLAARNVQLSARFVAKIGDYGLGQKTYPKDYFNTSPGTASARWVPLRWMAPESYFEDKYDIRTDIWMFAVLLWEIFSLAERPWNQHEDDLKVVRALQDGTSLSQPELCPAEIFAIMNGCWNDDAIRRTKGQEILDALNAYLKSSPDAGKMDTVSWQSLSSLTAAWKPSAPIGTPRPKPTPRPVSRSDIMAETTPHGNDDKLKSLEVPRDLISCDDQLALGAFGPVFSGQLLNKNNSPPRDVAVKICKGAKKDMLEKFVHEARLFATLKHNNLVDLYAVHTTSLPAMMALELIDGMTLLEYLHYIRENELEGSLTLMDMTDVMSQIADVMNYLSKTSIVHRDLCARSILIGTAGISHVKLADLGLSRQAQSSPFMNPMTNMDDLPIKWMSPEVLTEVKYSTNSDIWAFGVMCWEILTLGQEPYPELTNEGALKAVLGGVRPQKPTNCPDTLYEMMMQCWDLDPHERPDFDLILQTLIKGFATAQEDLKSKRPSERRASTRTKDLSFKKASTSGTAAPAASSNGPAPAQNLTDAVLNWS
eukprot:m.424521 g.424521  ORF g.424521 m.424521 type:complete len:1427 (-) comp56674_c0_seq1:247-4527(-)